MGRSSSRRWRSPHPPNSGALLTFHLDLNFIDFSFQRSIKVSFFLQKHQSGVLDAFFSGLSCVVSVPFYTAFLPLLFWVTSKSETLDIEMAYYCVDRIVILMLSLQSGHGRLARQMTLLIAFCDYLGNCIKVLTFCNAFS